MGVGDGVTGSGVGVGRGVDVGFGVGVVVGRITSGAGVTGIGAGVTTGVGGLMGTSEYRGSIGPFAGSQTSPWCPCLAPYVYPQLEQFVRQKWQPSDEVLPGCALALWVNRREREAKRRKVINLVLITKRIVAQRRPSDQFFPVLSQGFLHLHFGQAPGPSLWILKAAVLTASSGLRRRSGLISRPILCRAAIQVPFAN